jgi:hypothetical protein
MLYLQYLDKINKIKHMYIFMHIKLECYLLVHLILETFEI